MNYRVRGQYTIIEDGAEIGEGTVIWHYALIRTGAVIGEGCVIGSRVEIGPGVRIGDGTHIGADTQVHHPAQIGTRCFISPQVFISNDKYPMIRDNFKPQGVVIGNDVIIGAKTAIVGGVQIGDGAFVAMGAVVTKDVAEGTMVKGVPAREYGRRTICYPGTAIEHYGPLCPSDHCKRCDDFGAEQYHPPGIGTQETQG